MEIQFCYLVAGRRHSRKDSSYKMQLQFVRRPSMINHGPWVRAGLCKFDHPESYIRSRIARININSIEGD